MFCVLRYLQFDADVNKNLLFNPDCYVQILLDYFATTTKFDQTQDFVLCDDTGLIIDVKGFKPWMNASPLLPPFKVYYLVTCEKDDVGYTSFEPFLSRKSKECAELLGKLRGYLSSSGKSTGKIRLRKGSEDSLKKRKRSSGSKSSRSAGSAVVRDDIGKNKLGDKSLRRRKAQG